MWRLLLPVEVGVNLFLLPEAPEGCSFGEPSKFGLSKLVHNPELCACPILRRPISQIIWFWLVFFIVITFLIYDSCFI